MAESRPNEYDYLSMTGEDMAVLGFKAGEAFFKSLSDAGVLNGANLFIRVGTVSNEGAFTEYGTWEIGDDAAQYAANTDPRTGKLATVLDCRMDSITAVQFYGEDVGEGARRYVGGVRHEGQVELKSGEWLFRIFAGAASGVQGHFDQATMHAVLGAMEAVWAQHELAREAAGLPPSEDAA